MGNFGPPQCKGRGYDCSAPDPPSNCGPCGPYGSICYDDADSNKAKCGDSIACETAQTCNTGSNCQSGYFCAENTCCSPSTICVPAC